jgi:hypothetical protein
MVCKGSTVSPIATPPISAFTLAAVKALSSSVAMSLVFICCRASLRYYFFLKWAVSDRPAMKAAKKASAQNAILISILSLLASLE